MRPQLVFGHNPGPFTGAGSNAWWIEGRIPTLIDTGSGASQFLNDIIELASSNPPRQVLVTHAHPDHAGGAAALHAHWPHAQFAKLPWPGVDERFPVAWRRVADEDVIDAGDVQLWVVHTPGHSPDHVCYFEPRSGVLFGGDLVINGGTVVIPASNGGRLSDYMRSLRMVLELGPRRIYPGHGPVIDQPAALLRGYLTHRQAREQQIIEALTKGPDTIPALAERIYSGLAPNLTSAARESLLAHLIKLQDEGRAAPDGDMPLDGVWRLV